MSARDLLRDLDYPPIIGCSADHRLLRIIKVPKQVSYPVITMVPRMVQVLLSPNHSLADTHACTLACAAF